MAADVTPLRKVELRSVPQGSVQQGSVPQGNVQQGKVQQRTPEPEPLWREVLGSRLRELRRERGLHVNPWAHFPRLITSIDF